MSGLVFNWRLGKVLSPLAVLFFMSASLAGSGALMIIRLVFWLCHLVVELVVEPVETLSRHRLCFISSVVVEPVETLCSRLVV